MMSFLRGEPSSRTGWSRVRASPLAAGGLGLVAALAAVALAAPLLPLPDPHATNLAGRLLPLGTHGHPLGTDQLGRDLLSRLVWGTRTSLGVGFLAVLVAALFGTLIGLAAGYFRGWLDTLAMRGIDVLLAFPYLLLALTIVAALGPGLRNAMIAIAVANIPFFARTVRGTVLNLVHREFVEAARLAGAGHGRILFAELLPNVLPVVVIMGSTNLGWMILETAGLSFLGLGAQPPAADLGSMLGGARELLTTAPWVATLPGLVILLLVVGINLLGDGLRDLLDPRLRGGLSVTPATAAPLSPATVRPRQGGVLLRVEGLSTQFRQGGDIHRAVDDLSFELSPGERVAVVGESGSGKTVTALSLLGLVAEPGRIVGGEILFDGEDLLRMPESRRRRMRGGRIAYIPQDPMTALNPVLTIGSQLVEALRAHRDIDRAAARRRAVELLEAVRIPRPEERRTAYPHELSGGMRQRVVIAMALANDPSLVVADEATTALDATVQAEILELLDALCRGRGAALVFISHDLGVVRRLCERTMIMYAGRVVEEAATELLLPQPMHPYTRGLLDSVPELGRPGKRLTPIPGAPPAPNRLPPGCHFAPRCAFAAADCRANPLGLRSLDGFRRVRCVRAEELPPWPR